MKTKSIFLKFLFLFLTTIILASCTSSELEEEAGIEVTEKNIGIDQEINKSIYLIDKETSDRPGSQGSN